MNEHEKILKTYDWIKVKRWEEDPDGFLNYMIVEKGEPSDYGFVEYDGEGDVRQHTLVPGEFWYAHLENLDTTLWPEGHEFGE